MEYRPPNCGDICIRKLALSWKLFRGQDLHVEYTRKRKFTFPEQLPHIRVFVTRFVKTIQRVSEILRNEKGNQVTRVLIQSATNYRRK